MKISSDGHRWQTFLKTIKRNVDNCTVRYLDSTNMNGRGSGSKDWSCVETSSTYEAVKSSWRVSHYLCPFWENKQMWSIHSRQRPKARQKDAGLWKELIFVALLEQSKLFTVWMWRQKQRQQFRCNDSNSWRWNWWAVVRHERRELK